MQRRSLLKYAATLPLAGLVTTGLVTKSAMASQAMGSPLIYLSPVKSNGQLSACQAEVWFVADGDDFLVVTGTEAWRSQAVANGLTQAQVWVGDVGPWQGADGKWKDLPAVMTNVSFERDSVNHARLLDSFGRKYADEWGTWGPRFSNGLIDGSRVMLRYSPV